MSRTTARARGDMAEDRALEWLQQRGLALVERNWHCRFGELDLVMRDGEQWVFVEVRYRSSAAYGGALQSLSGRKAQRLLQSARLYLRSHLRTEPSWRIDLLAWEGGEPIWVRNALGA